MPKIVRNILLGSLIVLPIAGFAWYRRALNAYGFKVKKAVVVNAKEALSTGKIKLRLTITLSSKVGITFNVSALNLQFFVNGINVGTAKQQQLIQVPANGDVDIDVLVDLDTTDLKKNAIDLIGDVFQSKKIELETKGDTSVSVIGLPFSISVPVQDRYLLSLA